MDYYKAEHKYFRKVLFEFEQFIAPVDFNNTEARQKVYDELNELTFYLREPTKFKKENCYTLLKDKENFLLLFK